MLIMKYVFHIFFYLFIILFSLTLCYRELCCVKKKALDCRKIIVVGDNNHEVEV